MNNKLAIIENDIIIKEGLKAKFSSLGYKVAGYSGDGEIETLMHDLLINRPDVIVLDIILPEIDGHKLIGALRAQEGLNAVPIFVFTNRDDKESRNRSEALGADYYFIKTDFNIDQFVLKTITIIKNKFSI